MDEHVRLAARRRGQARAMAGRKCPKCQRGNALTQAGNAYGPEYAGKYCRYCDYSTVKSVAEIERGIREREGIERQRYREDGEDSPA